MAVDTEIDGRKIRVDYSITDRAHTPTPGVYLGRPVGYVSLCFLQGDHLSGKLGKPGNVRKFETCQGNVREKNLVREKYPRTVHY